jgi:RimJ/RimL family protein N-acetyltransferase
MSADSRYLRFNAPVSAPIYKQMAEATAVSIEESGFGLLAYIIDDSIQSGIRPLGIAYYVASGHEAPEFAVSIIDAFQNRGLGKNLLKLLFTRAHEAGLTVLNAHVLSCNTRMKLLISRSGKVFFTHHDGNYTVYRILV